MKKFFFFLILINCLGLNSGAQDTSNIACNASYNYNMIETFVSTFPYVYVQFHDQSEGDVTGWTWSMNDSIFSHEQNPMFGFLINRNLKCKSTKCIQVFNVCLTITTSKGCSSSYCSVVNPEQPPVPPCEVKFNYYSISADSIVIPAMYLVDTYKPVRFYGISPNNVVKWQWDFGDSTFSNEQNPVHAYIVNPGWYAVNCLKKSTNCIPSYKVCLTITTSDSCQTSYCDYVYPTIDPVPACNAMFSYSVLESYPQQFKFNNESDWDGGTVLWSFGDGTFSTENDPIHSFPLINYSPDDSLMHPFIAVPVNRSVYTVCLTITSNSGCISTYCRDIYVQPSDMNLCNNFIKLTTSSILGNNYCNGTASVELIDVSGNPVHVRNYLWSNGAATSEINNLCSNVTYSVSLTNDSSCVTAGSFSLSDNSIPWYVQYLNDSSGYTFQYLNYIPGYEYEWNFCDGTSEQGYYVSNKYLDAGNSCWVEIVVKNGAGIEVSREKIYLDQSITKINTPQIENGIHLFPVPPTDELNIHLSKPVSGSFKVQISDIMGRIHFIETYKNSSNNNISINVGQLPKGTYICRIEAGNYIMTSKFIK